MSILQDSLQRDLLDAAVRGDVTHVRLLLDNGVNPSLVPAGHEDSALHAAASCGHDSVVELLLERGCPVDLPDAWRYTALARTVVNIADEPSKPKLARLHRVVDLLLRAGANPKAGPGKEHCALVLCRQYKLEELEATLLPYCDSPYFT